MAALDSAVRYVGILTMPQTDSITTKTTKPFIINNNVKWFADRGVDIVPIPYTTRYPEKYMTKIHGLYLQGGPVYNEDYMRTAKRFLELSLEANQRGEYFPVWGTCHGFQTMLMVFGNLPLDGSKLGTFDARHNYMSNVHLTKRGQHSRIVQEWSPWFKEYLEEGKHVYFANMHGLSMTTFLSNSNLRKMFTLVADSRDRKGRDFVSIVEGKKSLPFYGTQFHPEAVPTLEPFRAFFIEEILKNKKKKQRHIAKTFRQRHHVKGCTRKKQFNHDKFQDKECYFF